MTLDEQPEQHDPAATDGAADPGDTPDIHENGGDPLPDDPEDAVKPRKPTVRTNMPPDPRRGR